MATARGSFIYFTGCLSIRVVILEFKVTAGENDSEKDLRKARWNQDSNFRFQTMTRNLRVPLWFSGTGGSKNQ